MRSIVQVRSTPNMKLNYHDRSEKVWFMMNTRQDNDMTNRTSVILAEYDAELERPIEQNMVYDDVRNDNNMTDRTFVIST